MFGIVAFGEVEILFILVVVDNHPMFLRVHVPPVMLTRVIHISINACNKLEHNQLPINQKSFLINLMQINHFGHNHFTHRTIFRINLKQQIIPRFNQDSLLWFDL